MLIGDPQKGHGVGAGIGNVMFHACRSFLLREEVQTGEVPPELATGEHSRQHAGGQYISCIKVQAGGNPENILIMKNTVDYCKLIHVRNHNFIDGILTLSDEERPEWVSRFCT